MTRGRGRPRSRSRGTTHPVAGRLLLPNPGWFPAGMEDPYPLHRPLLRLYHQAEPATAVAWTHGDDRGRFHFTGEQVGERPLHELGVEVYAKSEGRVEVCFESVHRRWSFRVAPFESPAPGATEPSTPEVLDILGPDLEVSVPSFSRASRLWSTADRPPRLSDVVEEHDGRRPFFAYSLVMQMRSWLWNQGEGGRAFLRGRSVPVIYPATSSWYDPMGRVFLDAGRPGTSRYEFKNSWLAHEYAHHIFFSACPHAPRTGGAHHWVEPGRAAALRATDERACRAFLYGVSRDFAEGFASFVGQSFLRTSRYEDERGTTDVERPARDDEGHPCRYGDWATTAYLWDLADPADDDPAALGVDAVLRALADYGRERRNRYITLPGFHEHLVASGACPRDVADAVLRQNGLEQVLSDWRAIPAAQRDAPVDEAALARAADDYRAVGR